MLSSLVDIACAVGGFSFVRTEIAGQQLGPSSTAGLR
jgi:hypothetical protein